jgi:hypothetical protein
MTHHRRLLAGAARIALLGLTAIILPSRAVLAAPAIPVAVTNTPLPVQGTVNAVVSSTSPLSVHDIDNPALQPFVMRCNLGYLDFNVAGQAMCTLSNVPAGKRFVIEVVTGTFQVNQGLVPIEIKLRTWVGNVNIDSFYSAIFEGNSTCCFSTGFYAFNQPVRLYADTVAGSGAVPTINVTLSSQPGGGSVEINVSGYLVNVP